MNSPSQSLLSNQLLQMYLLQQISKYGDYYQALFAVGLDETSGNVRQAMSIADRAIMARKQQMSHRRRGQDVANNRRVRFSKKKISMKAKTLSLHRKNH